MRPAIAIATVAAAVVLDPPGQTKHIVTMSHRCECNGANFNGFPTSISTSFEFVPSLSDDDFLIPSPPVLTANSGCSTLHLSLPVASNGIPNDTTISIINKGAVTSSLQVKTTSPRFIALQQTIGSLTEDSLRKTRKCFPLVPSSPKNKYLLPNNNTNASPSNKYILPNNNNNINNNNIDNDDQENYSPREEQSKYRNNHNIFKVSDTTSDSNEARIINDNNTDSPFVSSTSKNTLNVQKRGSVLKGIMRTKQDDPIDDHNSMDRTSCHQQHRRVHWDEQQLACKVEKGVMFSSSRKGRRSICALDSLMVHGTNRHHAR